MIKGLAITPPVIGRISIGHTVEKNGKQIPEKGDHFTLTTQVQGKDGWLLHPLHQVIAEQSPNGKIRAIPVRLPFNNSDLNLCADYTAFDRSTGRPLCVGNGETARRVENNQTTEVTCPTPALCPYAQQTGCKLYGRLNVQIEGQNDELGSFIFRTTGYNSVRTLAARLRYFEAVSGGNTKHLPLMLRLRAKSTIQSYRTPVFYADLTLRDEDTLSDVVCYARDEATRHQQAGLELAVLEETALQLLANGKFEDSEEEVPAVLEEFWPAEAESNVGPGQSEEARNDTVPKPAVHIRQTRLSPKLGAVAHRKPDQQFN